MLNTILYTIISVIIVSLVAFVGIVSLLLTREKLSKALLVMVSLSAGTLFGGSLLHLLPEAVEEAGGFRMRISLSVLLGIVTFFVVEKFVHKEHCEVEGVKHHPHQFPMLHEPHKHYIGIMNLVGDGAHNFIDGLIIAGAYLVSIPVGVATTIAVIFHEVPQELADFGVLLYSGYTRKKAILLNFLSAITAILGAIIGLILGKTLAEQFVIFILPFAAGGFLYIAGSNLIPELHRECKWEQSLMHFIALLVGIGIMIGLLFFG